MLSRETDADSYKHTRLDYHATVRELPSHERPRERLQHFAPKALSMAELLAIILRTGTRGDNALEVAHRLLSKYRALPCLARAGLSERSPSPCTAARNPGARKLAPEHARRSVFCCAPP